MATAELNIECLKSALGMAASLVPRNHAKALLSGVLLMQDSDGKVCIEGLGREGYVRAPIPGASWSFASPQWLPLDRCRKICSVATSDVMQISDAKSGINIRCDSFKASLQTMDAAEYPRLPSLPEKKVRMSAKKLKLLLDRTLFACDEENQRYALGGVKLEADEGTQTLRAIATDGRRLTVAEAWSCFESPLVGNHLSLICPMSLARIVWSSLPDDDDAIVTMHWDINRVHFVTDRFTMGAQLVEGKYPTWQSILQQDATDHVRVELMAGIYRARLEQASVIADADSRGIIHLFADGELSLRGITAEVGSTDASTPIDWNRENREERLDYRFVLDFLKRLAPEEIVTLKLFNPGAGVEFATDGWRYVVMPMAMDN